MRLRAGRSIAVAAALVLSACTSSGAAKKTDGGWFEARPLIMPGQHATSVRPDPFGSLRVPSTETAYYRLTRRQQSQLTRALRRVDCAHPPRLAGNLDRVVCDTDSDVFLLGAPIFTGNDVTGARPLPPSESVVGWQISLSLTDTATNTVYRWTTRHHTLQQTGVFDDVQRSSKPPCSLAMIIQCSDFTAFVSDNQAVSVPVTTTAARTVVIDGSFNEKFATRLADRLAR